jgi:adenylate cyclase
MTDAEQYTAVVEDMAPGEVVALINRYFAELFRAVFTHGGRVVDVRGDGMLAIWTDDQGDAQLRRQAGHGCIELLAANERFNSSSPARRLPTRIGVDFGLVALAPVGAMHCYDLRIVGDTVNTSSRLEQLNKVLGTRVLVSEAFTRDVENVLFRDLGRFLLRGKQVPVRVFELVGLADSVSSTQLSLYRRFSEALHAWETGRVALAAERFHAMTREFPRDGPARYFLAECRRALRDTIPASKPMFWPLPHPAAPCLDTVT